MSLSKNRVLNIMTQYNNDPQQLIAILLDIQSASGINCVEKQWAELAAETLKVPLSKVYDVLTFYAMFSTEPRGEYVIEICNSTPCFFGGACKCKTGDVVKWFESAAGISMGQTTSDGKLSLFYTSCVGACDIGPVVKIGDEVYGDLNEEKVKVLIKDCYEGRLGDRGQGTGDRGSLFEGNECCVHDKITNNSSSSLVPRPSSLEEYLKNDGFVALKKAVSSTPESIIAEVKKAKLLGRGGAAYPAGNKWEHLLHIEETPKYIVCNADEGEPGTFKDKYIMENTPFKLIEGIIIAGVVFKAKAGYIYVRGEYRKLQKQLRAAIEETRTAGYLSKETIGHDFDIYIISGAGAYVCGENSALLNSTEGKVGRPRIKPPHLAEVGLFLQPTLVNNVESFANIPDIVNKGGDAYLQAGHPDSGGTKLVCLSGHVKNRGVFEVPLGKVTLHDIIYGENFGGGLADDCGKLKFFHLGGQSGPIGSPEQLDTVYSYTDLKNARLSVGSGAIVVMDESVSILEYLIGVTEFFIHESCGKCVPCREGNRQLLSILKKLTTPVGSPNAATCSAGIDDLATLKQLVHTMTSASFCGLGQTAAAALNSVWKLFKTEFEANVTTGGKK